MPIVKMTKNYLHDYVMTLFLANNKRPDPQTGDPTQPVILMGGGSRSGKTVTIAQILLRFMEAYADPTAKNKKKLYIIVYRNTSVDSRKTFKDFIEEYDRIGLLPIEQRRNEKTGKLEMSGDYEKVESPKPIIRYKGHTVEFMGMPEGNQEAVGCDIAFINEILENKNEHAFTSISRRTTILTLADWNPKETVHYIYDKKTFNFHYPITTYLDNKWLPSGQKAKAESQCPWDFKDSVFEVEISDIYGKLKRYKVPEGFTLEKWYAGYYQSDEAKAKGESFDGFLRRKWLKPERPENCKEEDYHLYRMPHKLNYENGTVNRSEWLTYGEGIPSGQEGAIFNNVKWVDKFPESVDNQYFGLDYGFSNDPSSLTSVGNIGMDMYIEKLCYQKTGTSELLFDLIRKPILNEEKRRYIEANGEEWYLKLLDLRSKLTLSYAKAYVDDEQRHNAIDNAKDELQEHINNGLPIAPIYIVTDTADVYKGRGAAVEQQFTLDLNLLAQQHGFNWKFIKVGSKPIVPRIALMKKFNLHLVKDKDFEIEQQNYCYAKGDDGKPTNLPDKESKWNHIWDSAGYAIWKFFRFTFGS